MQPSDFSIPMHTILSIATRTSTGKSCSVLESIEVDREEKSLRETLRLNLLLFVAKSKWIKFMITFYIDLRRIVSAVASTANKDTAKLSTKLSHRIRERTVID